MLLWFQARAPGSVCTHVSSWLMLASVLRRVGTSWVGRTCPSESQGLLCGSGLGHNDSSSEFFVQQGSGNKPSKVRNVTGLRGGAAWECFRNPQVGDHRSLGCGDKVLSDHWEGPGNHLARPLLEEQGHQRIAQLT